MYLTIDATDEEEFIFYYYKDQKWTKVVRSHEKAGDLLKQIDVLLQSLGFSLSDVSGLAVLVGQGRFTATRVAVTIANTLAFACHIPVIAVTELDLDEVARRLAVQPLGQWASAMYSGEARVGGA